MKVIATYGPSIQEVNILEKVCKLADVLRLNISHQTPQQAVKTFSKLGKCSVPIMVDTSGPEVRINTSARIELKKGDVIVISNSKSSIARFDQDLYPHIKVGDKIYLDDGVVSLKLISKSKGRLSFKAEDKAVIKNRSGVNLKGRSVKFPALKKSDVQVLKSINPSFVALSYTRSAKDVKEARKYTDAKIIAKIENVEGIKNINKIIDEADGIMVARGDLGIELPAEHVPILQKHMVEIANNYAKPSIVATQVLYSMINNPIPTRAEVSDIANAVLDGADAIMLSNETAVGRYPLNAIREVRKASHHVAPYVRTKISPQTCVKSIDPVSDILSKTLYSIASKKEIDKIVVVTRSGYVARLISRFKLPKPIIAITDDKKVSLELNLLYNVYPVLWHAAPKRNLVQRAVLLCLEKGLLREKDTIVFAAAVRTKRPGWANMIEVHNIRDLLEFFEF